MSKPEMTEAEIINAFKKAGFFVNDKGVITVGPNDTLTACELTNVFNIAMSQRERTGEAVAKDSWVDLHAAWKGSDVDVSDSDVYTTGIHTPYHGNIIECHGNSEAEAIKLRDTVFEALSTPPSPTSSRELVDVPEQVRKALEVAAKLLAGDATYNGSYAVFKFNSHAEAMAKVFEARHELALAISLIPQEPLTRAQINMMDVRADEAFVGLQVEQKEEGKV
jgi:hypothetical protein